MIEQVINLNSSALPADLEYVEERRLSRVLAPRRFARGCWRRWAASASSSRKRPRSGDRTAEVA